MASPTKYVVVDTTGEDVGTDDIPNHVHSFVLTNSGGAAATVRVFEGGAGAYSAETGVLKFVFLVPANSTLPIPGLGGSLFSSHLHLTASAAVSVSITGSFAGA